MKDTSLSNDAGLPCQIHWEAFLALFQFTFLVKQLRRYVFPLSLNLGQAHDVLMLSFSIVVRDCNKINSCCWLSFLKEHTALHFLKSMHAVSYGLDCTSHLQKSGCYSGSPMNVLDFRTKKISNWCCISEFAARDYSKIHSCNSLSFFWNM